MLSACLAGTLLTVPSRTPLRLVPNLRRISPDTSGRCSRGRARCSALAFRTGRPDRNSSEQTETRYFGIATLTNLCDLLLQLLELFPLLLSLLHQLHGSARLAGSSFVLRHVASFCSSAAYGAEGITVSSVKSLQTSADFH